MDLENITNRVNKNTENYDNLLKELNCLESKLQDPNVWSDQKLATEIGQQK